MNTERSVPIVILLSIMLLILSAPGVKGQAFMKGNNYVSAGAGVGNVNVSYIKGKDETARSLGPFYLKWESAVGEHAGLGLNLSYFHVKGRMPIYSDTGSVQWKDGTILTSYGIQFRFNGHFGKSEIFDPYLGIGAGYRGGRWNRGYAQWSSEGEVFPIGFAIGVGTRIFVSKSLGVYMELGLEKAPVQFGLTYKIAE